MKIRVQSELLLISILTILLILVVTFFPSSILRIILWLPLSLFFPGYTLIAAVFPRRGQISSAERVALSIALSIAVISSIGLILNITPWGIRLYPFLVSVTVFILVTSLIAWLRRRREPEKFIVSFTISLPAWRNKSAFDRVLSIIIIAVILAAIGTVVYTFVVPKSGESFTEFYILTPVSGPLELVPGEVAKVTVGIANHENEAVNYQIAVVINGVTSTEIGPLMLLNGGTLQREITFESDRLGDNQEVELRLYKQGQSEVYRSLRLRVDVKG
jgi:uncharacterized membrane protein